MAKHTDETRIFLFIGRVKDLANRSQQEPVLVAIGFIYVVLNDILDAFASAIGQAKGTLSEIRHRENKP